ncbi:hypothetical protein RZS08_22645, partial [Arthrospira platensis SPKY1]|nr:hypothetical protein [Arthrospira platensis SPKY1]
EIVRFIQTAHMRQGMHTRAAILFQVLQAKPTEQAIFAHKRNQIGNGAHSHQIKKGTEFEMEGTLIALLATQLEQSVHELENQANGAQIVPGNIIRVINMRIDQQPSRR